MVLLVALLLAIITGWVRGGRLGNLQDFSFRGSQLIVGAFVLQLVIFSPLEQAFPDGIIPLLHGFSYMLIAVALLCNRRTPGMWLVMGGLLANLVIITASGGYMPASETALLGAGLTTEGVFHNSVVMQDTMLWFLGDVFYIPQEVPGANVFSIGDLLIASGMMQLTNYGMGVRSNSRRITSQSSAH